jgi:hypothetical protein
MIGDVHPESGSILIFFTHPEYRIQGSKRHRIPDLDPRHCSNDYVFVNGVFDVREQQSA